MPVMIKSESVEMIGDPSHSVRWTWYRGAPIVDREEVWATLRMDVPRIGSQEIRFQCDRYSVSDSSGESAIERLSQWRIYPDGYSLGKIAGVGDTTRRAIDDAGEPVIRAWLASDYYATSHRRAVSRMLQREVRDCTPGIGLDRVRQVLGAFAAHAEPAALKRYLRALDHLDKAAALLLDADD